MAKPDHTCIRCGDCCQLLCSDTNLSFNENGIAVCAIYKDRPGMCRDYPLNGKCHGNSNADRGIATVTCKFDKDLREHFVGGKLQSLRYKGRIVFHNLCVKDRERARFPMTKPNPNFESTLSVSARNPSTIPVIDSDNDHEIIVTGSVKPNKSKAEATISKRMEIVAENWRQKLKARPASL